MSLKTLFIFCAFSPLVQSVIVSTKYGAIEGSTILYPNASGPFKSISKFLGVPFAAPPVEELRFKAPQPPKEWKPKVRQAKKNGNICWQDNTFESLIRLYTQNFIYSEDCLYLDVFTPNTSATSPFPVMVYIHGGGYVGGTAVLYPADILALHGVVVVVIQYRLGPFGFLTTGDSASPGNFGMLDQVEALKWVKENIENFGGNPRRVTIFGESAGATSVSLHLMSPLSKGLFHQAIAESGVDFSPFAIQPTAFGVGFAKELARKLDCTTDDHASMVACIQKKDAEDIQTGSKSTNFRFVDYLQWAPVVDKNFLHDTPRNLRKKKDFEYVPLMISFNSHEGSFSLGSMVGDSFELMESVDNGVSPALFKSFLTKYAYARNSGNVTADLIDDALEFMYTPWPDNSDKYALRSQLVDLISDYIYFAPSHEVADIHSKVAPVYMYEFAHRPKDASLYPEWMGVTHGENVAFDFGLPFFFPSFDAADQNVSLSIMLLYANFAWSSNPTPQPVRGVTWQRFYSNQRAYLRVNTQLKMESSFNSRRMAFWNHYYPKLTQFDTTSTEVESGAGALVGMGTFPLLVVINIFGLL